MPVYELFCLIKPGLARGKVAAMLQTAGRTVLSQGGVLRDVKWFDERVLGYPVRKASEKHTEAGMWQVCFAAAPAVLAQLDHSLRVDEDVFRWVIMRRQQQAPMPTTHKAARLAHRAAAEHSSAS